MSNPRQSFPPIVHTTNFSLATTLGRLIGKCVPNLVDKMAAVWLSVVAAGDTRRVAKQSRAETLAKPASPKNVRMIKGLSTSNELI